MLGPAWARPPRGATALPPRGGAGLGVQRVWGANFLEKERAAGAARARAQDGVRQRGCAGRARHQ
eukprot:115103-Pyramimonas_sp.AAC.2